MGPPICRPKVALQPSRLTQVCYSSHGRRPGMCHRDVCARTCIWRVPCWIGQTRAMREGSKHSMSVRPLCDKYIFTCVIDRPFCYIRWTTTPELRTVFPPIPPTPFDPTISHIWSPISSAPSHPTSLRLAPPRPTSTPPLPVELGSLGYSLTEFGQTRLGVNETWLGGLVGHG